ncbi:MAG: 16S rRNA (guanine(966)-N(2))-methyltransferase RsmD [Deltaproteobacteria bacterium]|nr:16S rRNA (guanine(966)-N(2))-methyltransferase RsmD [Deltaproteobacteria bacterium]
MRVISGTARGRRLVSFRGDKIRPTADKVKGSLFNIIASNFGPLENMKVLDLFSGTGNLGIEALSRGADKAVFVDENRGSINILKENIDTCGFAERSEIIQATVESGIKILSKRNTRFNLLFLDPPYGKGLIEKTMEEIVSRDILEDGAVVIAEHSLREKPLTEYDGLTLADRRKYGDTELSFYRKG